MARKEERWITGKEATELLRKNSGRDDIPDSYIRSLARAGKVAVKQLDGRTNGYLYRDVASYVVGHRDKGKGDTAEARKAGSRRKASQRGESNATKESREPELVGL